MKILSAVTAVVPEPFINDKYPKGVLYLPQMMLWLSGVGLLCANVTDTKLKNKRILKSKNKRTRLR